MILSGSLGGVAGSVPPAASMFLPPFSGTSATEASSIVLRCLEVPPASGGTAPSDPAAGVYSVSVAAKAEECKSLAYSAHEDWTLGPTPPELVGAPGRVRATFVPIAWGSSGRGTPARFGAQVVLTVSGAAPWTMMSFACEPTTCSREPGTDTGPLEPWVFEGTVEALPPEIGVQFRAEAYVAEGTGQASLHLTGRLESVVVIPVEPAEDEPTG
ncbi:MAG: hypothetical protein ACRDKW_15445 [Actinomycetota bacterium]